MIQMQKKRNSRRGGGIPRLGWAIPAIIAASSLITVAFAAAPNLKKLTDICPTNSNAGPDKVLTCTVTQVNLAGSSTTAGVTFAWVTSSGGHIVSGGSTATPLVDAAGTYELTVTDPSNSCTATDTALVTVDPDKTSPEIICPASLTVACDQPTDPAHTGSATASDNCGGTPRIDYIDSLYGGPCPQTYTIARIWAATDVAGNVAHCRQVISVVDSKPPICHFPNDTTIFVCESKEICLPVWASDDCDSAVTCIQTSGVGRIVNGKWCYTADHTIQTFVGVRCTDDCGNYCEGRFRVLIIVNSPPTIAFGNDTTVNKCATEPICVTYTVSDPNGPAWLTETLVFGPPGVTMDTLLNKICFTPSGNGKYTIIARVTDSCGAFDQDTIVVTVAGTNLQLSCTGDVLTCDSLLASATVTFPEMGAKNPMPAPYSYFWTPAPVSGQGTPFARYNTPGTKKVVVTYLPTGCKDSCEATITQDVFKPSLTCTGDELTCDSTLATASVEWTDPSAKLITVVSYLWTPAPVSGQGTPYARYNAPGTKKVVVTYLPTGCKDSCESVITLSGDKLLLTCTGDELTCDSTLASATVTLGTGGRIASGVSYLWTPSPVSGQGTPFARYNTSGNKKVVVTDLTTGCKDSCEATITQSVWTPELSCSGDLLTCDSTLATASVLLPPGSKTLNGFSYFWTPAPVSGQGTPFARYDTPGNKRVVVTFLATGCKDSCEATITQDVFKPAPFCTGDELTCDSTLATAEVSLETSGSKVPLPVTYLWTPAPVSGQGTPWARYDTPGKKKVVVTFLWNGCKDSCEATITQSAPAPNANAGADKVLTCTVTQLNLSGSSSTPSVTFSWMASVGGHIVSGGSTATPLVDQPGTYTLTATNSTNGCKATDVALVTRNNTAPNANAGADKVLTCTATQLNLSGSSSTPGATFSWAASGGGHIVSGGTTATPLVDQPGTYTLTVTNPANGCTATDVEVVTRNNTTPNANAGADKLLTCTVSQINLSGSSNTPGATFSWAATGGGHIVSGGTTATPLVDQPGTYTLTVTNPANGCTATDVALVTRSGTAPNANAGPDKVLNCSVTQINLSGSSSTPGATFSWTASGGGHIVSGAATATPLVDAPGTYTLTVTNPANGCTGADVAVVTRDVTPPNANAGPDRALTCTLTQISLSGSSSTPGATFNWVATGGGHIVSGGTTSTPVVDATGTYTLTVTNPANGCTATDVAGVTRTANNAPVCHVPRDTSITTQVVPVQICLPVSGTDIDGDVVTCEKTSGAGTLSAGQWCFTWSAPKDTTVQVGIRCRDACDDCIASFRVTILYRSLIPPCEGNVAPVCKLPHDTTILQCTPTIVSLPVSATDANGNLKKCQIVSGPGTISAKGKWVYTPRGPETVHVTVRCVDSCDAYCEGSFTVSFVPDNLKPVCKPVLDTTILACPSVPIMIPLYTSAVGLADCYISAGPGELMDGFWVYTPAVAGDVRASIRCRSVCGNTWQWSLTVRVRLDGANCQEAAITLPASSDDGPAAVSASGVDPCACPARGDLDEDGDVSVSDLAILTDVIYVRLLVPTTGNCPEITRCDVNCDGVVDRKDVEVLTAYIFSQGTSLCDPCKNRTTGSWAQPKK